jgi:hypothetical protein
MTNVKKSKKNRQVFELTAVIGKKTADRNSYKLTAASSIVSKKDAKKILQDLKEDDATAALRSGPSSFIILKVF